MTTKPQHSSYWLDQDVFDDDDIETGPSRDETLLRMMRLAAVRRGISNFVNILTSRNDIKVEFSSGRNSYTDGSTVVISADEDANKFDPMVGLALHEAAHIKLSNFQFLTAIQNVRNSVSAGYEARYWNGRDDKEIINKLFHPALTKIVNAKGVDKYNRLRTIFEDIHSIMNVLEDRRIDKYVYQTAPGYRPYYDALYEKYFFTAEVGKNLRFNPKWRELTIENYINRLIYFFHPANKMDSMPGLEKLYKLMDVNTIERVGETSHEWETSPAYDTMPRLWKDANLIYVHILKFVAAAESAGTSPDSTDNSVEKSMGGMNLPETLQDLPNLDDMPSAEMVPTEVESDKKGKPGKFDQSKAQKEMKKAQEVIAGEAKKKKITKAEAEAISAIEQAQADMVDIKGDGVPFGRCIVLRKLNDKVIEQDWYVFRSYWGNNSYREKAIAAGRRMGAILAQRLQVRNDPLMTKQTRLPNGNIDRRLLAQLGMDIEQVFHKSRTDMHRPAMLHLTIDASGSMSGEKWNKTLAVAVALAYVGSKIRNVDTVISIRGGSEIPLVSIIFDSRRDQFQTFMKNVRKIAPAGGTPEGLCFKATLDLVLECADTHDVYFINFSDGEPSFSYTKRSSLSVKDTSNTGSDYYNYGGEHAWNHTRAMMNRIRERGVKVMSYFISDLPKERIINNPYSSVRAFKTMYGENAEFINVENASEVLRTLNKLLLTRGT